MNYFIIAGAAAPPLFEFLVSSRVHTCSSKPSHRSPRHYRPRFRDAPPNSLPASQISPLPKSLRFPNLSASQISPLPKSLRFPNLSASNTTQLEDLSGETIAPGTTTSKELCWRLGFLYPCSWNFAPPEPPKPAYVKECHDDHPSKTKWYQTMTCHWEATSSGGLSKSKSIPRIFTLVVLLFKSVKAIPLSRSDRKLIRRRTRSPSPLQLENLNGETSTAIRGPTTAKSLCWLVIWGYPCSWKPPTRMPYQYCVEDVPLKSDHGKTYNCDNWMVPTSAAQMTGPIPRIFTVPVLLMKAVRAVPVSRHPTHLRRSKSIEFELENLNGTDIVIQGGSKELKQCWIGLFLWPCWELPAPPKPKKKCSVDGFTHHVTCIDVPISAARTRVSIPRIFILPSLLVKTVKGASGKCTTLKRSWNSQLQLVNPKSTTMSQESIISKGFEKCSRPFALQLSNVAKAISALSRRFDNLFSPPPNREPVTA
ncbi:hypothetical protein IFR05_015067 [Cadophora sp. M221]|nr:hypothetical protein IFR05_015067 [Cadophora sp. M221]